MTRLILPWLALLIFIGEADARPRRGRWSQSAPSLKGSRLALARENAFADRFDLTRLRNREQLKFFIKVGLLVRIQDKQAYFLDGTVGEMDPENAHLYEHARPWTKRFIDDVLVEGNRLYGSENLRFKITSLVRTAEYQRRLTRVNPSAARGRTSDRRSSHLTGSTVDISKDRLSPQAKVWLRYKLRKLEREGRIQATEENRGNCFHVMVYPSYPEAARKHAAPIRKKTPTIKRRQRRAR